MAWFLLTLSQKVTSPNSTSHTKWDMCFLKEMARLERHSRNLIDALGYDHSAVYQSSPIDSTHHSFLWRYLCVTFYCFWTLRRRRRKKLRCNLSDKAVKKISHWSFLLQSRKRFLGLRQRKSEPSHKITFSTICLLSPIRLVPNVDGYRVWWL